MFKKIGLFVILLFVGISNSYANIIETEYKWFPDDYSFIGECYLVDSKTGGEQVKDRADVDDCRPSKTEFVLDGGRCYEVAVSGGRLNFADYADIGSCKLPRTEYKWFPDDYSFLGDCYLVDSKTGGEQVKDPADIDDCRPLKTEFVLDGGRCYEVAVSGGRLNFADYADIEKCL